MAKNQQDETKQPQTAEETTVNESAAPVKEAPAEQGPTEKNTKARKSKDAAAEKAAPETEALKSEIAAQKDSYLRLAAEFDNYKKREAASRETLGDYVKGQTVKALLGAVDGFERVLAADSTSADYAKGVEMTIKSFMDALKALGLEEINPVGEEFDVNLHQGVMRVEDDSVGANIVTEVLQKGYQIGSNVLRHAMVKVANCDM